MNIPPPPLFLQNISLTLEDVYYLSSWNALCNVVSCALILFLITYYLIHWDKPTTHCTEKKSLILEIIKSCPSLHENFRVPILGINNHFHTIYNSVIRRGPVFAWERTLLNTPDGGVFSLDWGLGCEEFDPIILILPGVTNSSESCYIRSFADLVKKTGWRPVVMVPRGCGGLPINTPRLFTYGGTDDLRQAVLHIREKYPDSPLYAVGFSMGANILAKYLGEYSEDSKILAAACLAVGFDGLSGVRSLNKFYNYILTTKMQRMVKRHQTQFEKCLDMNKVLAARHLEDFDQHLAVLYGFDSVEKYYMNESCIHHLSKIKVPLVFVNSKDDPLISQTLVPFKALSENNNLFLVLTERGGHLGWQEGFFFPRVYSWGDRFLIEYLSFFINQKKTPKSPLPNRSNESEFLRQERKRLLVSRD